MRKAEDCQIVLVDGPVVGDLPIEVVEVQIELMQEAVERALSTASWILARNRRKDMGLKEEAYVLNNISKANEVINKLLDTRERAKALKAPKEKTINMA